MSERARRCCTHGGAAHTCAGMRTLPTPLLSAAPQSKIAAPRHSVLLQSAAPSGCVAARPPVRNPCPRLGTHLSMAATVRTSSVQPRSPAASSMRASTGSNGRSAICKAEGGHAKAEQKRGTRETRR